jgi:hypothetical protein
VSKQISAITLPAAADVRSIESMRRPTLLVLQRIDTLVRSARDVDVAFVPTDPLANDPYAEPGHEQNVGWTVGHIVAHLTATLEEHAALAAELARGVAYHGRSRNEVAWQSVRTTADCRVRLAESRRMCVAALGMWPEAPHLDNTYQPQEGAATYGPVAYYLAGVSHAAAHMAQIADALAQARADRWRRTWRGRLLLQLRRGGAPAVVSE